MTQHQGARGVYIRHEAPGAPVEIIMWFQDGHRESYIPTEKALVVLHADIATAIMKNIQART